MDECAVLDKLIEILCSEQGRRAPELVNSEKADYFRALCNVRPPYPVSEQFLALQDEYLSFKTSQRGVVDVNELAYDKAIALLQGDITQLNADAIVNACNPALLGCFQPLHNCVDNIIHSRAGVQVRLDCNKIMKGESESTGRVRVTSAYNLPSRYIFHTVGPQICGRVTEKDERELKACYLSCIDKAEEMKLGTLAFCCISTGVYGYPNEFACKAAVETVKSRLARGEGKLRVIFDVYLDKDRELYERELYGKNR